MTYRTIALSVALACLSGCSPEGSVEWLEGAGYRWDLFNHRLSYLHVAVDDRGPEIAVVGGTSTTGLQTELAPECDSSTCSEFPFEDEAEVFVDLVRVTSRKLVTAVGQAEFVAGASGDAEPVMVDVEFSRPATEPMVAVIRGWTVHTDEPLEGGDACYQPRNGWLPRRLALTVGIPELGDDGRTASVAVSGAFEAGVTFEDERQCLDAVVDRANVRMTVEVVVLSGAQARAFDVEQSLSYAYGDGPSEPAEQPAPLDEERQVDAGDANAMGWSSIDFAFHQAPGETRGAYLRSLSVEARTDGTVSGHATNYSPATQLSGFDYAFRGTALGLDLPGDVSRRRGEGLIDITIDEAGNPEAQRL